MLLVALRSQCRISHAFPVRRTACSERSVLMACPLFVPRRNAGNRRRSVAAAGGTGPDSRMYFFLIRVIFYGI
jgi:hypothetical protein